MSKMKYYYNKKLLMNKKYNNQKIKYQNINNR